MRFRLSGTASSIMMEWRKLTYPLSIDQRHASSRDLWYRRFVVGKPEADPRRGDGLFPPLLSVTLQSGFEKRGDAMSPGRGGILV